MHLPIHTLKIGTKPKETIWGEIELVSIVSHCCIKSPFTVQLNQSYKIVQYCSSVEPSEANSQVVLAIGGAQLEWVKPPIHPDLQKGSLVFWARLFLREKFWHGSLSRAHFERQHDRVIRSVSCSSFLISIPDICMVILKPRDVKKKP